MKEADFFSQERSLVEVEDFMRGIQGDIKKGMAYLALSLARIKMDGLYLDVARSFKEYIALERTYLDYRESLRLATIGEKYFQFQAQFERHNVKLSDNMSKILLIDDTIVEKDPMIFHKINFMSVRQLDSHIKNRLSGRYVYPDEYRDRDVSVNGASLFIGDVKIRGINLNEARRNSLMGKRAVVVWIDDNPSDVRRVQRRVKEIEKDA